MLNTHVINRAVEGRRGSLTEEIIVWVLVLELVGLIWVMVLAIFAHDHHTYDNWQGNGPLEPRDGNGATESPTKGVNFLE